MVKRCASPIAIFIVGSCILALLIAFPQWPRTINYSPADHALTPLLIAALLLFSFVVNFFIGLFRAILVPGATRMFWFVTLLIEALICACLVIYFYASDMVNNGFHLHFMIPVALGFGLSAVVGCIANVSCD